MGSLSEQQGFCVSTEMHAYTHTRWFNIKYNEHYEFLPILLIPVKFHRDHSTGFFFILLTPSCDSKLAPIICILLV